ncbi:MAG: MerR family transcriptional regulator [Dehalococcoidia bacterium]|nr:MerR family transcriptional regulator [Dehalococcoidia bacterium]
MHYTVQAAARATGVSAHRLRTWERRYGIPAPARSATGRRLYSDHDLAVIVRMTKLIESGVPAPDAAHAALSGVGLPSQSPTVDALDDGSTTELLVHVAALNPTGLRRALETAFGSQPVEETLDRVVFPLVRALGNSWESGELTMVHEHFASEIVRTALAGRLAALPEPNLEAPTVVIACPATEHHDLGSVALWLLLARAGLNIIYLGPDVPAGELTAACLERTPDAICLAATATTTLPSLNLTVRSLIGAKVPGRIFVGGPAFASERDERPVAGEHLPYSVTEAAKHMARELTGSIHP